jgi:RNA polymerase sigma-70 factor (ECF subfamily)
VDSSGQRRAELEREFHTTRWSVVLDASAEPSEHAHAALETLCRAYWYPLYAYLRRSGSPHAEAEDLVQGFFARVIEKRDFRADRERGRFRAFLLAALRNFVANERDRARAARRGGREKLVSIDVDAEGRYARDVADDETPQRVYERQFALALLDGVTARLCDEQRRAKKEAQFERLSAYLAGSGDEVPYAELARELGLSEGAARVAVHRLRKRYGELLKLAVADTVVEPGEVEDELRALLAALRA